MRTLWPSCRYNRTRSGRTDGRTLSQKFCAGNILDTRFPPWLDGSPINVAFSAADTRLTAFRSPSFPPRAAFCGLFIPHLLFAFAGAVIN